MIISNTFNVLFGHEFYKASLTIYIMNLYESSLEGKCSENDFTAFL